MVHFHLSGLKLNGTFTNTSHRSSRQADQIDTKNILFICGGAFVGLEKVVEQKIGRKSMGFVQPGEVQTREERAADILQNLSPDDLVKFGMIPEFIGRMPMVAVLDPLDEETLVSILTKPRSALVKQYKKLLKMDNVDLEFKQDALRAIAREAYRRKTGARALRGIVEELMLDIMYELPSRKDLTLCTVTEEMVEKRSTSELLVHPSSLPKPESA